MCCPFVVFVFCETQLLQPARHLRVLKVQLNFQIAMIQLSLNLKMVPLGLTKMPNSMYLEEDQMSILMSNIPVLVKEKLFLRVVLGMILLKPTIANFELILGAKRYHPRPSV
tara:strand:+ start:494 stop:829 length:336 start_codon:yes stop_codon:yes gene_type:complete